MNDTPKALAPMFIDLAIAAAEQAAALEKQGEILAKIAAAIEAENGGRQMVIPGAFTRPDRSLVAAVPPLSGPQLAAVVSEAVTGRVPSHDPARRRPPRRAALGAGVRAMVAASGSNFCALSLQLGLGSGTLARWSHGEILPNSQKWCALLANASDLLIGALVYGIREALGETRETMAQGLGISYRTVGNWENGTTRPEVTNWLELRRHSNRVDVIPRSQDRIVRHAPSTG
jgi:DNA-binding XRE family transcriptional regulator